MSTFDYNYIFIEICHDPIHKQLPDRKRLDYFLWQHRLRVASADLSGLYSPDAALSVTSSSSTFAPLPSFPSLVPHCYLCSQRNISISIGVRSGSQESVHTRSWEGWQSQDTLALVTSFQSCFYLLAFWHAALKLQTFGSQILLAVRPQC